MRRRYGCGDNSSGQLGFQSAQDTTLMVKVPIDFKVRQIAAGASHSLLLSAEGEVYYSGMTKSRWETHFVRVVSRDMGEVQQIFAAGSSSAALLKNGSVYVWGDNENNQLGEADEDFSEPVLIAFEDERITQCALSSSHLMLLTESKQANDLRPVITLLSDEENALLESWNPTNLIRFHSQYGTNLSRLDAVSLLLSYLAESNHAFFSQLYRYVHQGKSMDLDGCFVLHVTDKSIQENLELIYELKECYFDRYRDNFEKATAAQNPQSEVKDARAESVLDGARAESVQSNTHEESPREALTASRVVAPPPTEHKIISPPPPRTVVSPPKRTSKSPEPPSPIEPMDPMDSMDPMDAQDAGDLDIDLDVDIDDLLNDATVTLARSTPTLEITSAKRDKLIKEEFEDKQCCYLMYRAIRLLHAQLAYVINTDRFAVASLKIEAGKEITILTHLVSILGIDSGGVEMALIKKEVIEVLSLLSLFCDSCSDLCIVFEAIMKEYAKSKADPEMDHFALLDVVFGLLYRIESQSRWTDLMGSSDILSYCDSLVHLLNVVFAEITSELDGYTRRLTAENKTINASGLTACVNFILRCLFSIYNQDYSKALGGDEVAFVQLEYVMDAVKKLCEPTFAFSTQLLRRAVDMILLESTVSQGVGTFLCTSPVYKGVECALFFLYSVITRDHPEKGETGSVDMEQLLRDDLNRVRSLLKPLSDMVITLDRSLQVLETSTTHMASKCWRGV